MKLEIESEPYAEVRVDLSKLTDLFFKTGNMETAIKDSAVIVTPESELVNKKVSAESLIILLTGYMDWSGILELVGRTVGNIGLQTITVRYFMAKYYDWTKLYPSYIDTKNNVVEFKEVVESGVTTILVQDLIKNRNYDLKGLIKASAFAYADKSGNKIAWEMR